MKKDSNLLLILILGLILVVGACSSDASEELPSAITRFTTQYFPGFSIKSYQETSDGGSIVMLSNGPTLQFDSDNQWTEIDGNGARLPQVLLYDQLPAQFYEYLQSTEQTDGVLIMKHDSDYYQLTLSTTVLTYDISTGKVTYPEAGEQ